MNRSRPSGTCTTYWWYTCSAPGSVARADLAAPGVPLVEPAQLDPQDRRLHGVDPPVPRERDVVVLLLLAVVAHHPDPLGQLGVVGGQRAPVPVGAQVLARVERERGEGAEAAGPFAVPPRAVRLAGVLYDGQVVRAGEREHRVHVGRLAVQVHDHQRLAARRDRGGGAGQVDVVGGRVDVVPDRGGSGERDRRRAGDERVGRGQHLVARPDPHGAHAELERGQPGVDAHRVGRLAVLRVLLLERRDVLAEDEVGALQDAADRDVHLGRDRLVLGAQVGQGDLNVTHAITTIWVGT